jgi:hypothetical protein
MYMYVYIYVPRADPLLSGPTQSQEPNRPGRRKPMTETEKMARSMSQRPLQSLGRLRPRAPPTPRRMGRRPREWRKRHNRLEMRRIAPKQKAQSRPTARPHITNRSSPPRVPRPPRSLPGHRPKPCSPRAIPDPRAGLPCRHALGLQRRMVATTSPPDRNPCHSLPAWASNASGTGAAAMASAISGAANSPATSVPPTLSRPGCRTGMDRTRPPAASTVYPKSRHSSSVTAGTRTGRWKDTGLRGRRPRTVSGGRPPPETTGHPLGTRRRTEAYEIDLAGSR